MSKYKNHLTFLLVGSTASGLREGDTALVRCCISLHWIRHHLCHRHPPGKKPQSRLSSELTVARKRLWLAMGATVNRLDGGMLTLGWALPTGERTHDNVAALLAGRPPCCHSAATGEVFWNEGLGFGWCGSGRFCSAKEHGWPFN
jgi:hypothetical protein